MKTIKLKTWPPYYQMMVDGKPFELRPADWDVEDGDLLQLQEWQPEFIDGEFFGNGEYTGREIIVGALKVFRDMSVPGLMPGFCIIQTLDHNITGIIKTDQQNEAVLLAINALMDDPAGSDLLMHLVAMVEDYEERFLNHNRQCG